MKKIGVLLITFLFLLFITNNTHAIINAGLTSWKADNISGWACKDNEVQTLSLNLVFKEKIGLVFNQYANNLSDIAPTQDLSYPVSLCSNNMVNKFYINLYDPRYANLLKEVLTKYPVFIDLNIDDGTGGDNPWETPSSVQLNFSCMHPNQTIMKLNKALNGHIYLGNQSTLKNLGKEEYPICYADLQCNYRALACNAGEKPVVSLFYSNNSHASDPVDSNYAIKMCCTTSYVPNPISETKWYNMLGHQISTADKCDWTQIGTWGMNLVGQNIRFNIKNLAKTIVYSGIAITPQSSSPQLAWQTIGDNTFNFDALLVSNPALNKTSSNLVASNNINPSDYNITLITPKCGNNFSVNNDVNFNIFMNTTKNLIEGTISFGDGQTGTFSNIGSSIAVFTHRYTADGTKTVVIETKPSPNQVAGCPDLSYLVKRRTINIIIIDPTKSGEYVAACIDSPEDLSRINQQTVFCNASSTRAINYSTTTGYTIIPSTKLSFIWRFSDQTTHEFRSIWNSTHLPSPCYDTIHEYINPSGERYSHTISCDVPTTSGTTFTKYFQVAGDHYANLVVNLN